MIGLNYACIFWSKSYISYLTPFLHQYFHRLLSTFWVSVFYSRNQYHLDMASSPTNAMITEQDYDAREIEKPTVARKNIEFPCLFVSSSALAAVTKSASVATSSAMNEVEQQETYAISDEWLLCSRASDDASDSYQNFDISFEEWIQELLNEPITYEQDAQDMPDLMLPITIADDVPMVNAEGNIQIPQLSSSSQKYTEASDDVEQLLKCETVNNGNQTDPKLKKVKPLPKLLFEDNKTECYSNMAFMNDALNAIDSCQGDELSTQLDKIFENEIRRRKIELRRILQPKIDAQNLDKKIRQKRNNAMESKLSRECAKWTASIWREFFLLWWELCKELHERNM